MGDFVEGPFFQWKGAVAGCSMATTFVRVYTMDAYDAVPRGILRFASYIDDAVLVASGTRRHVLSALLDGAVALHHAATKELGSSIALDKVGMISSDSVLAKDLESKLGKLAGPRQHDAKNLGIADTAGRPLRGPGRGNLATKRRA